MLHRCVCGTLHGTDPVATPVVPVVLASGRRYDACPDCVRECDGTACLPLGRAQALAATQATTRNLIARLTGTLESRT